MSKQQGSKPLRTPPIAWVRAFCAAGQLSSFKAAAESLNLAPSTISHEIRKLEAWLQCELFSRGPRKVTLTAKGVELLHSVQPAFAQLDRAFQDFVPQSNDEVRIGMLPYFASELVLPDMNLLTHAMQGRVLHISSNTHLAALSDVDDEQRLDAVVRYASEPPVGFESIELTRLSLAVAAAKSTSRKSHAGEKQAADRRIELSSPFDGWKRLASEGVELPFGQQTPLVVDNYASAMRAVEQDVGVGIALLPLCCPWLRDGRIKLVSEQYQISERLWLVWTQGSACAPILHAVGRQISLRFEQLGSG